MTKAPKLFLDMDGVLADFFGAWEDKIGFSYKEITSQVIFGQLAQKHIVGTDFFSTLNPMDDANSVVEITTKHFGKPHILSAPLVGDILNTVIQKNKWLAKHIGLEKYDGATYTSEKEMFAAGNILIDDYLPNLTKWAKAGGIGIKYKAKSEKYGIKDLDNVLNNLAKQVELGLQINGQILFLR